MKLRQGRGRVGHTFLAKVSNLTAGPNKDESNWLKSDEIRTYFHERKNNDYAEETLS